MIPSFRLATNTNTSVKKTHAKPLLFAINTNNKESGFISLQLKPRPGINKSNPFTATDVQWSGQETAFQQLVHVSSFFQKLLGGSFHHLNCFSLPKDASLVHAYAIHVVRWKYMQHFTAYTDSFKVLCHKTWLWFLTRTWLWIEFRWFLNKKC